MRRAAAPQRRRLLRVLLVRLGPLPAEAGGRVPSQMSTRRARKAIAWPSVASSKVSRMARRVVARKPSDKRDGVAPAATLDRTSRTTPLPPSESVTLHTKSVTVRTGGRAVSVVNLRLRDAAPSVNVTVGQRSRESSKPPSTTALGIGTPHACPVAPGGCVANFARGRLLTAQRSHHGDAPKQRL
jgi:hypothetical protein